MSQIRDVLKTSYSRTENGLNDTTCMSKNRQTSYETYHSRFSSCYEHFLKVSLKSDDSRVVRYLKTGYLETKYGQIYTKSIGMPRQEWTNMLCSSSLLTLFIPKTFPETFIEI